MCASSSSCAAAFFSASDAALSWQFADGKINVQSTCLKMCSYVATIQRICLFSDEFDFDSTLILTTAVK
jgi:hypothetical protein